MLELIVPHIKLLKVMNEPLPHEINVEVVPSLPSAILYDGTISSNMTIYVATNNKKSLLLFFLINQETLLLVVWLLQSSL